MDNSPKLLFPKKKQLPSAYPTPCFETTLYKLLKSTFKEKYDSWTKTSKVSTERKILSVCYLKISNKSKILQQNN